MNYCGIDVASKSSCVFVSDGAGWKLANGDVATTKAGFAERLKPFLRGGLTIAIETAT